jgi:hypothetical protein
MCSPSSFANKANIMLSTSLVFSDSQVTENSGYEFFNPKNSCTILFRPKTHTKQSRDSHKPFYIFKQPKKLIKKNQPSETQKLPRTNLSWQAI